MAQNKEPSMTNTKREILDSYKQLKKEMEEKDKQELKPEKEIKAKQEKEVIKVADTVSAEGAMKEIGTLKIEVNKILSQLSDKLENATAQYEKIKSAIEVKDKELQEVYEIEKSAHSLAVLIEAQRRRREDFEKEMEDQKQRLDGEIATTREQWEKDKKTRDEAQKEAIEEMNKKRQREEEEYKYRIEREKAITKNQFEDEKERLQKELDVLKEETEKQLAEKGQQLNEREKTVSEREKQMDVLQKQVDTFDAEVQKALDKAIKETTEKLNKEHAAEISLMKKEYEGVQNVMQSKIESLENLVKEQNNRIGLLSKQLEDSYQKVQDIAVKSIEGGKESTVVNKIERMLKDTARKQETE